VQIATVYTGKTPVYQRQDSLDPAGQENRRSAGVPLDPESAAKYEEIFQWDAKLKEALRFEDYESAAVCRDKIRELKKGNETDA